MDNLLDKILKGIFAHGNFVYKDDKETDNLEIKNSLSCSFINEPGRLPSMGSHRVRHYWCNLAAAAAKKMAVLCSTKWWAFKGFRKFFVLCFDDATTKRTRSNNKKFIVCSSNVFGTCSHSVQDGCVPDTLLQAMRR